MIFHIQLIVFINIKNNGIPDSNHEIIAAELPNYSSLSGAK
jgi:hypothetical protein